MCRTDESTIKYIKKLNSNRMVLENKPDRERNDIWMNQKGKFYVVVIFN